MTHAYLTSRLKSLIELSRGKYAREILGAMSNPTRGSDYAKGLASRLREYRRKPLQQEITATIGRLKSQGRPMKGMRIITPDETITYPARSKKIKDAIGSMEKARAQYGRGAFDVGANLNDEVLIRERDARFYGLP